MNKTIKTSELTGPALDWTVAKCIAQVHDNALLNGSIMHGWWISGLFTDPNYWIRTDEFNPSTNWAQGGPIIEREKICTCPTGKPSGSLWSATDDAGMCTAFGPTPLIAAMRCYCCAKLGNEVEIPEELL